MMILMVLLISQAVTCQSSQKSSSVDRLESESSSSPLTQNLQKIQSFFADKLQTVEKVADLDDADGGEESHKPSHEEDGIRNSKRKAKSLPIYHPYYMPRIMPYGASPQAYFHTQMNKDLENAFANEWLSRTEPFKRNTPLLDSPTYYIRLPPNPYAFVPGLGYVSRPPSLSEPEIYDSKPESTVSSGNDIFHDPFYRLPISFVSNGKPTSVYQLANDQVPAKPDANFINLNKGPYVFNGKPSEIFLVAQIYNALYGDELNHFYP